MPINNITQTVSTLPPAGARGVDVQTQFVIKQEDFQDHLQGTTVTELNTLKTQMNTMAGEMNTTATTMNGYASTASAGASTATTKAGEALTSASEALTSRNQASTFATNSSTSATKASQWADNNYNVEVEAGRYSAKHWSTVAQNTVSNKIDKVASTDYAIVRFNGTTGDVQNSSVTVDDNGNIATNNPTSSGNSFLSLKTAGTERASLNIDASSGLLSLTAGSAGYGGQLVFNTNGSEKMRIDSAGNVGIGVTPINGAGALQLGNVASLGFQGQYGYIWANTKYTDTYRYITSAPATSFEHTNGSHTWKTAPSGTAGNVITWTTAMTLDASGDLTVPHIYNNTTASAANMFIDSTGKFFRSTSSKQYKTDIETIDKSYVNTFFDNARPIYYKSLSNNDNPTWGYWGFIAEEIAEFDKRLVHWRFDTKEVEVEKERILEDETVEKYTEIEKINDESKPMIVEGVMYERITVLLTAKVQEQQKVIDSLISRIEILEGAK